MTLQLPQIFASLGHHFSNVMYSPEYFQFFIIKYSFIWISRFSNNYIYILAYLIRYRNLNSPKTKRTQKKDASIKQWWKPHVGITDSIEARIRMIPGFCLKAMEKGSFARWRLRASGGWIQNCPFHSKCFQ